MNDNENRAYYNRTHYFGGEGMSDFEDLLDELENDKEDDDEDENEAFEDFINQHELKNEPY